jgi:hypothetical protein
VYDVLDNDTDGAVDVTEPSVVCGWLVEETVGSTADDSDKTSLSLLPWTTEEDFIGIRVEKASEDVNALSLVTGSTGKDFDGIEVGDSKELDPNVVE